MLFRLVWSIDFYRFLPCSLCRSSLKDVFLWIRIRLEPNADPGSASPHQFFVSSDNVVRQQAAWLYRQIKSTLYLTCTFHSVNKNLADFLLFQLWWEKRWTAVAALRPTWIRTRQIFASNMFRSIPLSSPGHKLTQNQVMTPPLPPPPKMLLRLSLLLCTGTVIIFFAS